jgi:hypothetical protein
LLGELGGIIFLFMMALGIIISPLSKFNFILSASKKLFYGRTSDNLLFKGGHDIKTKKFLESGFLTNMESGEIRGHWPIDIKRF